MTIFAKKKRKRDTQMQRANIWIARGEGGRRDEMNWEIDVYTIDIMYKIDN